MVGLKAISKMTKNTVSILHKDFVLKKNTVEHIITRVIKQTETTLTNLLPKKIFISFSIKNHV